jgi:hypothetical protein
MLETFLEFIVDFFVEIFSRSKHPVIKIIIGVAAILILIVFFILLIVYLTGDR